jgi:hypothetical protein
MHGWLFSPKTIRSADPKPKILPPTRSSNPGNTTHSAAAAAIKSYLYTTVRDAAIDTIRRRQVHAKALVHERQILAGAQVSEPVVHKEIARLEVGALIVRQC